MTSDPEQSESSSQVDVSSPANVVRIGTVVKQFLERLDLPFDTSDGPPTNSELRITQDQPAGWLEGHFHGTGPVTAKDGQVQNDSDDRGTGNHQ